MVRLKRTTTQALIDELVPRADRKESAPRTSNRYLYGYQANPIGYALQAIFAREVTAAQGADCGDRTLGGIENRSVQLSEGALLAHLRKGRR